MFTEEKLAESARIEQELAEQDFEDIEAACQLFDKISIQKVYELQQKFAKKSPELMEWYKDIQQKLEAPYCATCNGSGEGQYDGSRCPICHGSGHKNSEEERDIELGGDNYGYY